VNVVQKCDVCGDAGYLEDGPIVVTEDDEGPPSIGQCRRCRRFICSRHAEPLDLQARPRRWFGKPSPGPRTLCCPFDRGVLLGQA
jgi:hypothetical protein